MSIGKKIGGGFCAVILLTLVLGLWAIYSMSNGATVAENMASDRLPRFRHWTEMQNDLLEGAYFGLDYFTGGEKGEIDKALDYMRQFEKNIAEIRAINSRIYYKTTAGILDKASQDATNYISQLEADQKLYIQSESLFEEMTAAANSTLKSFGTLIAAMGKSAASQEDMASASAIYGQIGSVFQDLLVAERNNEMEKFAQIQERLPQIRQAAQRLGDGLTGDNARLFTETMQNYRKFSDLTSSVATTLQEFLQKGVARYERFENMYADMVKMVNLTASNSDKFAREAASELWNSTRIIGVLLAIVVILAIIVAIVITRLITKPLAVTQRFAQDVSNGNLEKHLDVETSDETGLLADALRSMVTSLKQNIGAAQEKSREAEKATQQAKEAMTQAEQAARKAETARREGMLEAAGELESVADIISSASTELSSQIEQSDQGAAESASRLQEAATAMNEMNATVQEVARNAGSASEASAETRQKALAGQQVVQNVVHSMDEVHQTSLALKKDMVQLNERAMDINRIMGVISDIADQTNLLALNAAIEAARAGEAGRGFAVVADEVRKLAEKTMSSTQDVSNAIHAIQESADKSMRAVDQAVSSIGSATEYANQSGEALEEIVATVEATSDQVRAIAAASEEQSAASEEINRSVTEVNDMSRMTAEAMRESATAVSHLAEQAQKLTALISQMKKA